MPGRCDQGPAVRWGTTGKIRELTTLLASHADQLEADFQQFYRLPLAPGLAYSWRRFAVLVDQLPAESRFSLELGAQAPTSAGPPDLTRWANGDRLLALIADQLTIANWQRSGGKQAKPPLLTAGTRHHARRTATTTATRDQVWLRNHLARIGPPEGAT